MQYDSWSIPASPRAVNPQHVASRTGLSREAEMSEQLRVGVVGLGAMGSVMLEGFHRDPRWELVAACDLDPRRVQAAEQRYPNLAGYESAGGLICHDSLDVVAVATPPASHVVAAEALAADRHVLCEKPLAPTSAEAQQLVDAARAAEKRDLVAVVDYQLRYSRAWQLIRTMVNDGYVGAPRYALCVSQHAHVLNQPWGWSFQATAAGGVLSEYGSHCIDVLRTLFGDIHSVIGRIETLVDRKVDLEGAEQRVDADDYASLSMTFDGGVKGDLLVNGLARTSSRTFVVHGTKGSISLVDDGTVLGQRDGHDPETFDVRETDTSLIDDPHDTYTQPFARLISHLADSIEAGKKPAEAATFLDGLAVVQALEQARSA